MIGLKLEISEKVATVTLDRPPVNAINAELYKEISQTFERLGALDDVRCAVLTSTGTRVFSAGKDLHEFLKARVEDDPQQAAIARRSFNAVRTCQIPVIAAVNGAALGAGCILAAVCDIVIAADNATFGLPEIDVGRCGGGAHLGRLIPQGKLRRMFFTGTPITAAEAYRVGLVDEITSQDTLMKTARQLATAIAAKSPLGLRYGKRALNEAEFLPLEEGYAIEQAYSTKLMHTADAREATRAVVEKRMPVFTGK